MTTRLSNFCDKLLEAGWLAALIVAPLYFNIYSSRVFEPDKATLVRSIALAMIAAWIIKRIEIGFTRAPIADVLRAWVRGNPLLLPTLAVITVYLVSTIFSVAPNVSFWGSYQRLEGTYTTFSYIVIFLIAANSLRTRAQLDRVISTIIVTSFPISFYGLLQHFKLDPLPWGGDVTIRIAANMGNSIFVAAYLIMVVPLALARWLETLARATRESPMRIAFIGAVVVALIALTALWFFDFTLGTLFAIGLLLVALVAAPIGKVNVRDTLLTMTYTLVLAAQITAIFFSQSRGPWLGLAGGLFVFVVLYALTRGARRVVLGAIGLTAVGMVFLVLFNLPGSPLAPLKNVPYLGRLGQIFDAEAGTTGRVRELIWQGSLQLVSPHAPLWSPITGDDPINPIRPFVGYGPEAMYVAFNPFYPPELGRTEARNASPDRSHNETFDSLVTTGLLGFGVYILLFVSIFYFGLRWLGLITTPGERNAFVALWLAGGFFAAIVFGAWRGWHYIGVALPAGMILGFFIFLVADVLRRYREKAAPLDPRRALWLCALIAALIGHFIEIHFGIAIVSTRLYFWFYAALLLVIGMNHLEENAPAPMVPEPAPVDPAEEASRVSARRRKRRQAVRPAARAREREASDASPMPVFAWTAIATLIIITLGFEFVTNQSGSPTAFGALQQAVFFKGGDLSLGVFLLLALTWVLMGIVALAEEMPRAGVTRESWLLSVGLYAVISFTAWVWYVLVQLRLLTQPGDLTEAFIGLLGIFYIALFLIFIALAFALAVAARNAPAKSYSPASVIGAPLLILALGILIYGTNFSSVTADIWYKAGTNYDSQGAWDRSVATYQTALGLQPAQDFYALFLGRAYLEAGRSATDAIKRSGFIEASERILLEALKMNPLNTDHSANLARLHRLTAAMVMTPADKTAHLSKSSSYYASAIRLSPNAAHLRNEWALTYMLSDDLPKMREQLDISLKLDATFAQTRLYLGEYYRLKGDASAAVDAYLKALALDPAVLSDPSGAPLPEPFSVLIRPEFAPRAIEAYRALAQTNPVNLSARLALAELYQRTNQADRARQELEQAVQAAPADIGAHLALVNFLSQAGQIDRAITAMSRLLQVYPQGNAEYTRLQEFYQQLQNLQNAIQAAQKSPNDVNAHKTVAGIWKARGQPQFAIPEYETVARLASNDYDAQKNLALLNLQLNQLDAAERALVAAVALAPENEKPMWQNIQAALNAHKARQFDQAIRVAQAAVALALDTDKPAVQAYITLLQAQVNK